MHLNVQVHGDGSPAFVFVHGFGCALQDWQGQIDALSAEFRCVALDLLGHGASDRHDMPTMASLGAAVNEAVKRSGAGQVILVGHSLGAKVIREAYAQSSEPVVGMVFIEGRFHEEDRDAVLRRTSALIDRAGFAAFARTLFTDMFVPDSDPTLRARIIDRALRLDPGFARGLYLQAVVWDPDRGRDTLKNITVPTLLLQSTYTDASFQRVPMQAGMRTAFMEVVAELVPGAREQVITGCGHFPMLEAADLVNQALRGFADRLRGRQATAG